MIKHKVLFILFFTIILTPLFSQQDINKFDESGKRQGIWQKNYSGTSYLRYKGQFSRGKEIDTFKYYKLKNKKSVLSAIKVFSQDSDLVDVIFYASNGKIVSKGQMNGKIFIGKWIYFHKNSDKVMTLENYDDSGQLKGERTVYFVNGIIAEIATYKNDQLNGISKWFSESNRLLQESNYIDNKLDGPSKHYDNLGNLKSEGNYKQNKRVGVWSYYNANELLRKVNHDTETVLFKKQ